MSREEQVEKLTAYMANFIGYTAKVLPADVIAKLDELAEREDGFLPKVIYQTMKKNQKLAKELDRPSCQDTGVLQFWVKCGTAFPLIGDLEALLKEAVIRATFQTPLRHNSITQEKTWERELPPYSGILCRTVINVRFTPIWQAAAAPFRERPWC